MKVRKFFEEGLRGKLFYKKVSPELINPYYNKTMKFIIRADASVEMGTGHVMRCLALADYLREGGAQITFISRRYDGNLANLIATRGFDVGLLEPGCDGFSVERDGEQTREIIHGLGGCDCLIVDNYLLDVEWERAVRGVAKRLFVIDDLARIHDCDGLLDQNLHMQMEGRYKGRVPAGCKLFLGPGYALLRREFEDARRHLRPRNGEIRRILVNFGGSDAHDVTSIAIEACSEVFAGKHVEIIVVAGGANPHKDKLKRLCSNISSPFFVYHEQVSHMARLMGEADIAIGAGGSSHWERCFLGLPALVITTADNQVEITRAVASRGACVYVGDAEREERGLIRQKLADNLAQLAKMPHKLLGLSQKAVALMPHRKGFYHMLEWLTMPN